MAKWCIVMAAAALGLVVFDMGRHAPNGSGPFTTIVLGAGGGLDESNLTAYLLRHERGDGYVALDAGTLYSGVRAAERAGSFADVRVPDGSSLSLPGWVMHDIRAYLITHAHLDHVAGLVLNSPDDDAKPIYALPHTIDILRDHLFNWDVWPNMGSEGAGFVIGKYTYERLEPGTEVPIADTGLTVEAHPLSHDEPYQSTAFLVRAGEDHALFVGDSGPDPVEGQGKLRRVWERVAPLVRAGRLRGVYLEVSYPDGRAEDRLFGHLTPSWMLHELRALAEIVNPDAPQEALEGLTVIVTAVKPSYEAGPSTRETIRRELAALNDLGVRLIVPERGARIEF